LKVKSVLKNRLLQPWGDPANLELGIYPKGIQTFKTIPETLYSLQAETVAFNTQKYHPGRRPEVSPV
jgi:hypothetical protein